jgi:hypothetical protein
MAEQFNGITIATGDALYLRLDTSNDPLSGNLDFGSNYAENIASLRNSGNIDFYPNGDISDGLRLSTITNDSYLMPIDSSRSIYIGNDTSEPTILINTDRMEFYPGGRTFTSSFNKLDFPDTYIIDTGAVTFSGALAISGTIQANVPLNNLGSMNLFKFEGIVKNNPGVANGLGSPYVFVNTGKYEADGAAISVFFQRSVLIQPTFRTVNGGTMTVLTVNSMYFQPSIGAGVTATNIRAFELGTGVFTGAVTNYAGYYIPNLSGPTNIYGIQSLMNNGLLINHTGTAPSYFNGDLQLDKDLIFTANGGGLPFGEIWEEGNAVETAVAVANTWYQVTIFTNIGQSNLMTPSAATDDITVGQDGKYFIAISAAILSGAGAAFDMEIEARVNNGATRIRSVHTDRRLTGGGSDLGSLSLSGSADLTSGDTVEVWVRNLTNTTNILVKDINLYIRQDGG